jgi:hypothetical protein
MPPVIELVDRKPITFDSAINQEGNFIKKAAYVAATQTFYGQLGRQRDAIASIVRHHLNLSLSHTCTVTVAPEKQWIRGSFNVCIPVAVEPLLKAGGASGTQKLLLRCPFPFKLAEARYPGTVDEKLGCEVGNDDTQQTIGQHEPFADADAFASDMLSFHDSRLLSHPKCCF